jgi:hypothetical protein
VRVTGGGLNIPANVNLNDYAIIVENGDINFNGNSSLTNVILIANNGSINLGSSQTENSSILAAKSINHNRSARFGGTTLLANGRADLTFNGATKGITDNDKLRVISAGNITFNGALATRGSFWSQGNFISNGFAEIYGDIRSRQNIIFNGALTFTYTAIDDTPPLITAHGD